MHGKATVLLFGVLGLGCLLVTEGCGSSGSTCTIGSANCACTGGGACDNGLTCVANKCVGGGTDAAATGGTSGGTGGMSGTDGGTDAPVTTDPETACAGVAAYCTKVNECAPLVIQVIFGSVENCVTRYKLSCKDSVLAPDSGLTAAAVNACAAALPGATCEALIYNQVEACNFKGKRSNGAACGTDSQCLTGHCALTDSLCGVCAAQVGAGSTCSSNDDCMAGFTCSEDAHCVLPGAGGTACSATQPCRYGFYCRAGSCVTATATAGGTCQDPESCLDLKGLYCNTSVQTCATIAAAAPGSACGFLSAGFVTCAAGACRFADTSATQGICSSLAADGAQCGTATTSNSDCQFPARCVAGRCKTPSSAACQ